MTVHCHSPATGKMRRHSRLTHGRFGLPSVYIANHTPIDGKGNEFLITCCNKNGGLYNQKSDWGYIPDSYKQPLPLYYFVISPHSGAKAPVQNFPKIQIQAQIQAQALDQTYYLSQSVVINNTSSLRTT